MDRVRRDLDSLTVGDQIDECTDAFAEAWKKARVGEKAIATVIRYMEEHPGHDYGEPGALVHFIEHFRSPLYLQEIEASIARAPTAHVVRMLNRLINGTRGKAERNRLLDLMRGVLTHDRADDAARTEARGYLDHHGVPVPKAAPKTAQKTAAGDPRFAFARVIPVLGLPTSDPALIALLGPDLAKLRISDGHGFLVRKDLGIQLSFVPGYEFGLPDPSVRKTVFAAAALIYFDGGSDHYTRYAGDLPHGLRFGDSLKTVLAAMGEPTLRRDDGTRISLRFPFAAMHCKLQIEAERGLVQFSIGHPAPEEFRRIRKARSEVTRPACNGLETKPTVELVGQLRGHFATSTRPDEAAYFLNILRQVLTNPRAGKQVKAAAEALIAEHSNKKKK